MKIWFENLKISKKLILGFLFVSILGIVTGLVGIINLITIADKQQETYDQCTLGIEYAYNAENKLKELEMDIRDLYLYYEVEKDHYCNEISAQLTAIEEQMKNYGGTISDSTDQVNYDAMSTAFELYKTDVNELLEASASGKQSSSLFVMIKDIRTNANDALDAFESVVEYKDQISTESIAYQTSLSWIAVYIMIGVIVVSFVIAMLLSNYISGIISKPMRKFAAFAEMLAIGDMDIDKVINEKDRLLKLRKDEVGILADSFEKVITSTIDQVQKTQAIAGGDMTTVVTVRSENDIMGIALSELVDKFHGLAASIVESAVQVDSNARLVADSSTSLSQGATEQASTVEELSASLEEITSQTTQNAQNAKIANDLANDIRKDAEAGNNRMAEMLHAMEEVNVSSGNISKIIKVIEDIAFQTNILALNAAVEAARAGQHGRGFAVVAEEVRTLAGRSAQAANETTDLIKNSIKTVEAGSKIANETAKALDKIVSGISKTADLVNAIAMASNDQAAAFEQIDQGILQVSQVVQNNAAVSEECAAASEELSHQADELKVNVSIFKIKTSSHTAQSHANVEEPKDESINNSESHEASDD
ncbi:MAG: methyl-accepting chemotaxis protein [Oscillospiraceae bacterium]